MLGTHHLALFITSGILLNLTPGQDTMYIVGRSISQGRRAGLLSVAGILAGSIVHTCAAAFGLSAILTASAEAFTAIRLAGAAYLVYLGIKMVRDRSRDLAPTEFGRERDWPIFRAGFFTNLLNPKVALFFLAFLPQFVDPAADSKVLAFLFLGALFMFNGTIWCLIVAWGASTMSRRLRESPSAALIVRRAAGALFVGLGLRLAAER
jgi:threonine/homoserine/homoserine lactone efflux protein